MNNITSVAVIGAGPYGLSIAAHLRAKGIAFRIFGNPMDIWKHRMPKGMFLKSDGFASNLYDPGSTFTLKEYCRQKGVRYADQGIPVRLETFIAYGLEFQKKFVPDLEECQVVAIEPLERGFAVRLSDGESFVAGRVVVAVGITYFESMPEGLRGLPQEFVTHSSKHSELGKFKGRDVTIFGAGSSAIDIASLLGQEASTIRMVTRGPSIKFHVPTKPLLPPFLERIRKPRSGLGPGWRSRLCTDAPLAFRLMPGDFRRYIVRRHLGPSPGWFVKATDLERVQMHTFTRLRQAEIKEGRVHLSLTQGDGAECGVVTDHVIAATGYKPDLRRLPFLDERLLASIETVANAPVLSSTFESSVHGLYFVGLASANTFGPMLRFAYGAGFAARRLSAHLRRVGCADNRKPEPGFAAHRSRSLKHS